MTDRVPEPAHAGRQRSSQGQAPSQKAEQNFIALNERGINGFPPGPGRKHAVSVLQSAITLLL